jgi:hypothetical protein
MPAIWHQPFYAASLNEKHDEILMKDNLHPSEQSVAFW